MTRFDKENIFLWLPSTVSQEEDLEKLEKLLKKLDVNMEITENERIHQYRVKITYSKKRVNAITNRNAGKKKIYRKNFSVLDAIAMIKEGFTQDEVAALYGMSKWTLIRRINDAKQSDMSLPAKLKTGKKTGRRRMEAIVRFRGGVSNQTYSDTYMIACFEGKTGVLHAGLISEGELRERYDGDLYDWDNLTPEVVSQEDLKGRIVEVYTRYQGGMYFKCRASEDMSCITDAKMMNLDLENIPFWAVDYYRWRGIELPAETTAEEE
ncbi:MAG: hypothetical protein PHW34_05155 [Hespellia sp.]|nr:hypothetical protein [Hespellia sp.]